MTMGRFANHPWTCEIATSVALLPPRNDNIFVLLRVLRGKKILYHCEGVKRPSQSRRLCKVFSTKLNFYYILLILSAKANLSDSSCPSWQKIFYHSERSVRISETLASFNCTTSDVWKSSVNLWDCHIGRFAPSSQWQCFFVYFVYFVAKKCMFT